MLLRGITLIISATSQPSSNHNDEVCLRIRRWLRRIPIFLIITIEKIDNTQTISKNFDYFSTISSKRGAEGCFIFQKRVK